MNTIILIALIILGLVIIGLITGLGFLMDEYEKQLYEEEDSKFKDN